jgi:hypothetical protein
MLYLVNMEAGISQCGGELLEIFEKCFGLCIRCQKFFQKFSGEYILEGPFAAKDKIKNNGLMLSFLNLFGSQKGFEHILNFI